MTADAKTPSAVSGRRGSAASGTSRRSTVRQCRTCPWREGARVENIPHYDRGQHEGLEGTIRSGLATLGNELRLMACHHSREGDEFPCAGWLANQLGPGNNIGLRMAVAGGRVPGPQVDGPQRESFEQTFE